MNKFLAILALAAAVANAAPGAVTYGTTLGAIGVAQPLAYAAQPVLRQAIAQPVLRQQIAIAAPQVAYAQPIAKAVYAQPIVKQAVAVAPEPFDPNPQYNYGYSVSDALTGDSKSATESRNGDLVQGQYSLVEPDGAIRTVTYTADAINGFNAVVDRSPAVAKVAVAAAPVAYKTAAPALAYQPALAGRAILG